VQVGSAATFFYAIFLRMPESTLSARAIPADPGIVRRKYSRLKPLTKLNAELRGWTLDVLGVARSLEKKSFSLDEMYARDAEPGALHPANRNIRPKIRQQLQRLRDLGIIEFVRSGYYAFCNSDLASI
jgi:type II restriction enzyme